MAKGMTQTEQMAYYAATNPAYVAPSTAKSNTATSYNAAQTATASQEARVAGTPTTTAPVATATSTPAQSIAPAIGATPYTGSISPPVTANNAGNGTAGFNQKNSMPVTPPPRPIAPDLITPQVTKSIPVDLTYVGDGSTSPINYTGVSSGGVTTWNPPPVVDKPTGLSQTSIDELMAKFNKSLTDNNKTQNDAFKTQMDNFASENKTAMTKNNQSILAGNMDAFKNFTIPTSGSTEVNMGNYNDNRKASQDQWWSPITGRR